MNARRSGDGRSTVDSPSSSSGNGVLVSTYLPVHSPSHGLSLSHGQSHPHSSSMAFSKSRFDMATVDRRWLVPLLICSLLSILLTFLTTYALMSGPGPGGDGINGVEMLSTAGLSSSGSGCAQGASGEAGQGSVSFAQLAAGETPSGATPLPVFAYVITGSKGDGGRMRRLLLSLYHPRNEYLLHMDLEASPRERVELVRFIRLNPVFAKVGNVHIVARANLVTYRGPTMISTYLHCAAILLKQRRDWDWFINLSASDYPLMTQDDMIHVFSYLPRDLNFVEHFPNLGWKEYQRARPIVIDPGIYSSKKSDLFFASQRRSLPTAFKLYTGSAWVVLSRAFVEFCIWGWDNLPRLALMYYTNFVSSPEGYFQTVICNAREFKNTTVNSDLHFIRWDVPAQQHPITLSMEWYPNMTESGVPFARKFPREADVLNRIDKEVLQRRENFFTRGGWCGGSDERNEDPCLTIKDPAVLRPTEGAQKLQRVMLHLLEPKNFKRNQCL